MAENGVKKNKKSKFNVGKQQKDIEKRTFNGIIFSSEMEMKYYRDVLIPEKEMGNIRSILLQPKYLLQPKFFKYGKSHQAINYVSDFEVEYSDGRIIIYDVKGMVTETAKVKFKMFDYVYPEKVLELVTLSPKYGGWIKYEELIKLRSKNKRDKNDGKNQGI